MLIVKLLYNEEATRQHCTAYEVSTVYEGLAECSAYWHCGACDGGLEDGECRAPCEDLTLWSSRRRPSEDGECSAY